MSDLSPTKPRPKVNPRDPSRGKASYIVELEPGVWCAPWPGDPGRTLAKKNAKRFRSLKGARGAVTRARKYRTFPSVVIFEVPS